MKLVSDTYEHLFAAADGLCEQSCQAALPWSGRAHRKTARGAALHSANRLREHSAAMNEQLEKASERFLALLQLLCASNPSWPARAWQ